MAYRQLRIFTMNVAALLAITSCSFSEFDTRSLADECYELLQSSPTADSSQAELSSEDVSAMSEEERTIWLDAADDMAKLPLVVVAFCELASEGNLPGADTRSAQGQFTVSAARNDIRTALEERVAPAHAEKKCIELFYVELEQDSESGIYFFCERNSKFFLLSGYRRQGDLWQPVE